MLFIAGLKPKARLVAHEFEEDCLSKCEKESPTCFKDTFRAMLGLKIQNEWALQAITIKTAFLQGRHIDREVFVNFGNLISAYMAYPMLH